MNTNRKHFPKGLDDKQLLYLIYDALKGLSPSGGGDDSGGGDGGDDSGDGGDGESYGGGALVLEPNKWGEPVYEDEEGTVFDLDSVEGVTIQTFDDICQKKYTSVSTLIKSPNKERTYDSFIMNTWKKDSDVDDSSLDEVDFENGDWPTYICRASCVRVDVESEQILGMDLLLAVGLVDGVRKYFFMSFETVIDIGPETIPDLPVSDGIISGTLAQQCMAANQIYVPGSGGVGRMLKKRLPINIVMTLVDGGGSIANELKSRLQGDYYLVAVFGTVDMYIVDDCVLSGYNVYAIVSENTSLPDSVSTCRVVNLEM